MVRLVDQALRGPLFERAAGLASSDVTLADPAVGTGTFLLGALRRIAANVEADQGAGAVGPAIASAANDCSASKCSSARSRSPNCACSRKCGP